jgi:hypothetical protein
MIALRISILAGALLAATTPATAALGSTQTSAPQQAQCRWETPAQFDPKTGPRAPVWTCPTATEREPRCGHYELYLPIWAVGRALPWVRQWVSDRC